MTLRILNNQPPKDPFRWYKWYIAACVVITLIILFSSCSSIKNIQKKTIGSKSDSIVDTISVTTSTETITGSLEVIGDTLLGETSDIIEHPIEIEDGDLKLEVKEVKGKIVAKAIQKPKTVVINDTKVTNNSISTKAEVKKELGVKEKDKHKEITGINLNYLWWLLLLLLIPIWKYRKLLLS